MSTKLAEPPFMVPPKAEWGSFIDRFREIISDPLNLLIERTPLAGLVTVDGVILHNGHRVPHDCYYEDFTKVLALNRGVHEPLEEFVFQELLRQLDPDQPMVMIELGAYWGHYSMWMQQACPKTHTICIEPNANNLEIGRRNFALNGLTGEFIRSFVSKQQFGIDAFMEERGLDSLDMLHTDIQGYELEMLEGARTALERQTIKRLFISTHSDPIHQAIIQTVTNAGYRVDILCDVDHETTSCDGLVVASLPDLPPLLPGFKYLGRTEICTTKADDIVRYVNDVQACRAASPRFADLLPAE